MTHEEAIDGYAKINRAYNEIFDALQTLKECGLDDADLEKTINYSLNVMDKALDYYKENYVDSFKARELPAESDPEFGVDAPESGAKKLSWAERRALRKQKKSSDSEPDVSEFKISGGSKNS